MVCDVFYRGVQNFDAVQVGMRFIPLMQFLSNLTANDDWFESSPCYSYGVEVCHSGHWKGLSGYVFDQGVIIKYMNRKTLTLFFIFRFSGVMIRPGLKMPPMTVPTRVSLIHDQCAFSIYIDWDQCSNCCSYPETYAVLYPRVQLFITHQFRTKRLLCKASSRKALHILLLSLFEIWRWCKFLMCNWALLERLSPPDTVLWCLSAISNDSVGIMLNPSAFVQESFRICERVSRIALLLENWWVLNGAWCFVQRLSRAIYVL